METTQMTPGVQIQKMKPDDIGAIFEIDRMLTGDARALDLSYLVTEDLGSITSLCYVAEYNRQIVGYIIARHTYIGEPVMDAVLVQGIGVHPIYHRQGIALKLMNALIKETRSKCITHLRVMLSETDDRLRQFFSKIGFHPVKFVVYDKLVER